MKKIKLEEWFELDIGMLDNLYARITHLGHIELKTKKEFASFQE